MKALIFRRDLIKFAFLSLQIEIEIASWKVSIHFIKIKCQEQYIFFIKEKKTRCRPPPFAYLLHVYLFYKSRSFVIVKKNLQNGREIFRYFNWVPIFRYAWKIQTYIKHILIYIDLTQRNSMIIAIFQQI